MRTDKYLLFVQMLADGKISTDEYARLVNLTANAEERVNKSFHAETSEEIAIPRAEVSRISGSVGNNDQRNHKK